MNQPLADEKPNSTRTYVDPQGSFALEVPPEWLIDNSGQQGTLVMLFQPVKNGDFRPNLGVVAHSLAPLTPEEYVTLSRLQAKRLSGKSTLDVDQVANTAMGGQIIEWSSLQMGPVAIRFRQLLIVNKGIAFTITATAGGHQFEGLRVLLESMLSSFRTPADYLVG